MKAITPQISDFLTGSPGFSFLKPRLPNVRILKRSSKLVSVTPSGLLESHSVLPKFMLKLPLGFVTSFGSSDIPDTPVANSNRLLFLLHSPYGFQEAGAYNVTCTVNFELNYHEGTFGGVPPALSAAYATTNRRGYQESADDDTQYDEPGNSTKKKRNATPRPFVSFNPNQKSVPGNFVPPFYFPTLGNPPAYSPMDAPPPYSVADTSAYTPSTRPPKYTKRDPPPPYSRYASHVAGGLATAATTSVTVLRAIRALTAALKGF